MKKTSHLVGMILLLSGCLTVREDQVLKQINVAAAATPTPTPSPCNSSLSPFGGGTGGAADPYLVCTATHLSNVKDYLSSSFKLYANINLTGITFNPIGTTDTTSAFSGEFDGNNYAISNWTYNNGSDDYAIGFFRKLAAGGVIKNLTLSALNLNGNNIVAGFAGKSEGSITSVTLRFSTLNGKATVAGIVGDASNSASITNVTVNGTSLTSTANGSRMNSNEAAFDDNAVAGVVALWDSLNTISNAAVIDTDVTFQITGFHTDYQTFTGGVVGVLKRGSITQSSYQGTVSGKYDVGGIVGFSAGTITDSHAQDTVMGQTRVGGVAGMANQAISRSSMVGSVVGDLSLSTSVGGIAGVSSLSIADSFFTGTVFGRVNVGGVLGLSSAASISDSYSIANIMASDSPVNGAVGGFVGSMSGGSLSSVYSSATSINAGFGTAHAMIGSISPSPTPTLTNYYFKENVSLSTTNGGTSILSANMNTLGSFTGFDPMKWRTPTAYSGRSGLSPVLAWECSLAGVTCAP